MKTLVTYDIKKTTQTIHTELKERLVNHYKFKETIDGRVLPNTTLVRLDDTLVQASKDFLAACKDVGAVWEKYVVVDWSSSLIYNN